MSGKFFVEFRIVVPLALLNSLKLDGALARCPFEAHEGFYKATGPSFVGQQASQPKCEAPGLPSACGSLEDDESCQRPRIQDGAVKVAEYEGAFTIAQVLVACLDLCRAAGIIFLPGRTRENSIGARAAGLAPVMTREGVRL